MKGACDSAFWESEKAKRRNKNKGKGQVSLSGTSYGIRS